MKTTMTVAALALLAGSAGAQWAITESWTGLDGEDGTVDWIEVTWLGAGFGDTGTLYYDDVNPSLGSAGQLDSFTLGQGESAVFLIDSEPADDDTYSTAAEEFTAIWGAIKYLGQTNGGGGLGQGGDEVHIGLNNGGTFQGIASLIYNLSGDLFTFEQLTPGTVVNSTDGVNGAYESNPFFNDNLGLPNNTAVLVGSPGAIPAPGVAGLFGLAGLAAARRRRA